MEDLRTLSLNGCNNLPFILALNPEENLSKLVTCPKLESLVFYDEAYWPHDLSDMVAMARERALRGVKLKSITLISLDETHLEETAFELREYVQCVEHRIGTGPPRWGTTPGDGGE